MHEWHCHRGGVDTRPRPVAVGASRRHTALRLGTVASALDNKHPCLLVTITPLVVATVRGSHCTISASPSLQPNGLLAAKIPPRTFTSRPTEINCSFNTNNTTLSPHLQTDEHFRFSFYLVYTKEQKKRFL